MPGDEQALPRQRQRPLAPPAPSASPPEESREPERLLLDQIAAGELDPHLTAIAQAIRVRYELLQTIGSAEALAQLNVGDRVRINHHASPRYLHGAFENAFYDDAQLPCPGTVIDEDVEVLSVSASNSRRELIATCQRAGRRHQVALLDIDIHADPPTSRLLAAYRRWVGD